MLLACILAGACSPSDKKEPADAGVAGLLARASQGDVQAMTELGLALAEGRGVQADAAQAADWMRKAAEAGHPEAQYRLGLMYENGLGVAQGEPWEMLRWLNEAASKGHAGAQTALGRLYLSGGAVEPDDAEAARWFERAAMTGSAEAQRMLGELYLEGRGVERNAVRASHWLGAAAEQGDGPAMLGLGRLYQGGRGVKPDPVEAFMWFGLAADAGLTEAAAARDQLGPGLTQEQRLEAERLAALWKQASLTGRRHAGD